MSSSSMMSKLCLYGVPLSQPFRAVAWVLLQKQVPFTVKIIVPGATTKIGSRHENYLQLSEGRTNAVPVLQFLQDDDNNNTTQNNMTIMESPAILTHLCERYQWSTLLPPPASQAKSLVDSYLHWHHTGTRRLAVLTRPLLRPELGSITTDQEREESISILTNLESAWLGGNGNDTTTSRQYLAGTTEPTIADILAYEEILQAHYLASKDVVDFRLSYPNIWNWMQRMQTLPYHEDAHRALEVLTASSNTGEQELPLNKRLGAATKAGLTALSEAQMTFTSPSSSSPKTTSKL